MAVRLGRVKIHRFRDVAPGTELRFSHGWNVLLGRNAKGKTTLLHLISMALRGDFTSVRWEAFEVEYELSDGEESLHAYVFNELQGEMAPDLLIAAGAVAGDALQRAARPKYRETIRAEHAHPHELRRFASVASLHAEHPTSILLPEAGEGLNLAVTYRILAADPKRPPPATVTAYRMDEGVDLFRVVCGIESDAVGLPGVIGIIATAETAGRPCIFCPYRDQPQTGRRAPHGPPRRRNHCGARSMNSLNHSSRMNNAHSA